MKNIVLDIKVANLLEQIEAVNKMIDLHKSREDKAMALLSINQYVAHRQDFIDQLNAIFNKYSLSIVNSKPISSSNIPKVYEVNSLVLEGVNEPKVD